MAADKPLTAQDIFNLPTTTETVVFYTSLGVTLASFSPLFYAVWFRNFPPMKAQHVGITITIAIGGIVFNISNNIAQGMAMYNGALGACRFWGAWVLFTFGLAVFLSAIYMRLVLFYRVFISGSTKARTENKTVGFFRKFWPFFAMWSPALITSIVITSLKGPQGIWLLEDHGLRACAFSDGYLMWIYVYFLIMIIASWVLYFRMRKIANAFNGFRMAIWTIVVSTIVLVVSMVLNLTKGSNSPWGRIAIALTNMAMLNGYIWMILGPPVIGHMFWRERTMRSFMNTLHKDSLVAQQTRSVEMEAFAHDKLENNHQPNSIYDQGNLFADDINQHEMKMEGSQFEFQDPLPVFITDTQRML
ncbi:hypothetical protein BX661DRAFT_175196 [Kickxella alabastrina]|uniref:uncharacterized protein n=1 Tax=Kickxella alabastrina TaxID=61397 RepID=UPI00222094B7|nr:uncharacterized protein BX661DRAFT_175196 [Kickxella alabastrina]KAI7834611.1 hypothetical protein BX661DRAFT_175196 [Kickxella alabastrina]